MEYPNKRGRKPLFTSQEVDEIQRDVGTLEELAMRWRASRATIARIRSYAYEYAGVDKAEKSRTHKVVTRKVHARPSRLGEETLRAIAEDTRSQREVAEHWGVSIPYVAKLRAKYGTTHAPRFLISTMSDHYISHSEKSDEELAAIYQVPVAIIRRIRDGKKNQGGV